MKEPFKQFKVICISLPPFVGNNSLNFTVGKIYTIIDSDYELSISTRYTITTNSGYTIIILDSGHFMPLEEYRNSKINKILDES
jgi:hypothetical protein